MGYIRHHAIIVTTFDGVKADEARKYAVELFSKLPDTSGLSPSPLVKSAINCYYTFLIPPDGSKEGWNTSKAGDVAREIFVLWLEQQRYEDGSSPYCWVEVQYGDDNYETRIVNDSDKQQREKQLAGSTAGQDE